MVDCRIVLLRVFFWLYRFACMFWFRFLLRNLFSFSYGRRSIKAIFVEIYIRLFWFAYGFGISAYLLSLFVYCSRIKVYLVLLFVFVLNISDYFASVSSVFCLFISDLLASVPSVSGLSCPYP